MKETWFLFCKIHFFALLFVYATAFPVTSRIIFFLFFRKQAEIDASKAPQVLTIDHDESIEVSGNEISTDESDNDDEDVEICYKNTDSTTTTTRDKTTGSALLPTTTTASSTGSRDPSEVVSVRPKDPSRAYAKRGGGDTSQGGRGLAASQWAQEAHEVVNQEEDTATKNINR